MPDWQKALTQPNGRDADGENMEIDSSTQSAGQCVKRLAVAACDDGGPEGRRIRIDDCEHTIFEGKTSGSGTDDRTKLTVSISHSK